MNINEHNKTMTLLETLEMRLKTAKTETELAQVKMEIMRLNNESATLEYKSIPVEDINDFVSKLTPSEKRQFHVLEAASVGIGTNGKPL